MNTQVLRLKDNLTAPEHFYVHVVGMQKDESPEFGTGPTEVPPLDTRPKNATRFLFSDWQYIIVGYVLIPLRAQHDAKIELVFEVD